MRAAGKNRDASRQECARKSCQRIRRLSVVVRLLGMAWSGQGHHSIIVASVCCKCWRCGEDSTGSCFSLLPLRTPLLPTPVKKTCTFILYSTPTVSRIPYRPYSCFSGRAIVRSSKRQGRPISPPSLPPSTPRCRLLHVPPSSPSPSSSSSFSPSPSFP